MKPAAALLSAAFAIAPAAYAQDKAKPAAPDVDYCARRDADPQKCVIQDGPPNPNIIRKKPPPPPPPPKRKAEGERRKAEGKTDR